MKKVKGIVLNIGFEYDEIANQSYGKLYLKTTSKVVEILIPYDPYFYIKAPKNIIRELETLSFRHKNQIVDIRNAIECEKIINNKKIKVEKIVCAHPKHVPTIRKILEEYPAYEYKIKYHKKVLIDHNIIPFSLVELQIDDDNIYVPDTLKTLDDSPKLKLNKMAFDIETSNPDIEPDPNKDPVVMISYKTNSTKKPNEGVITYRNVNFDKAEIETNENKMINKFVDIVAEKDPDILIGYNSTNFDFPYLYRRSKEIDCNFAIGKKNNEMEDMFFMQHGNTKKIDIPGRIHFDAYYAVRFLNTVSAINLTRLTLKAAYKEFSKQKMVTKELINTKEVWKAWEDENMRTKLAEYNLGDSDATLFIADKILPLEIELCRLTKQTLTETAESTTGRLVESLLMIDSDKNNEIIPNIPGSHEVGHRMQNPIKGAYVKMPEPGIYENIIVFDFRGLYPSIIVSHNIDPTTLNCKCCTDKEAYISPMGHKFCSKRKGLIPRVLEKLLDTRIEIKKKLKTLNKNSIEYQALYSRSQAYKIVANSTYGYTVYARSRWYCRQCGSSITAWARHYIKDSMAKAEKAGFEVLYGDTDSLFLSMNGKTKTEALKFMKEVNKHLPAKMELELENIYPRGVFVSKRTGNKGAKKKYALIDEKGSIKIRGFELVRSDWSNIAKKTQMKVLEAILKEGDSQKAGKIVIDIIKELKEGKIPLEELIITTKIRKKLEDYELMSPEVSAAKKAQDRGAKIKEGSIIDYIITKGNKTNKKDIKKLSISEKAEPAEDAKDYDPEYYIDKQVMPAVLKILKELGFTEEQLKGKGKQSGLGEFF